VFDIEHSGQPSGPNKVGKHSKSATDAGLQTETRKMMIIGVVGLAIMGTQSKVAASPQGSAGSGSVQAKQDRQIHNFYKSYAGYCRQLDAAGLKALFQKVGSKRLTCRLPNESGGFDTMSLGEFISNVRQFYGLAKKVSAAAVKVERIQRSQGSIVVRVRYEESYLVGTGATGLKLTRVADGLDLWRPSASGAELVSYRIQSETSKTSTLR